MKFGGGINNSDKKREENSLSVIEICFKVEKKNQVLMSLFFFYFELNIPDCCSLIFQIGMYLDFQSCKLLLSKKYWKIFITYVIGKNVQLNQRISNIKCRWRGKTIYSIFIPVKNP